MYFFYKGVRVFTKERESLRRFSCMVGAVTVRAFQEQKIT